MTTTEDGAVAARLAAVEQLGASVRSLVRAVVETEAGDATLARAAALAEEAAELLRSAVRPPHRLALLDGVGIRDRIYSPVTGPGNPVAPPLRRLATDPGTGQVTAECTLHRVHEGPPTYAHGGISAMLLDQVLGRAAALGDTIGLTRSLRIGYRRPVPLGEPLRLVGRLVQRSGHRIETAGEIATAARPDAVLVSATATFVVPTGDQLQRLFGHVESGGGPIRPGD